jgi:probable phosphoglycerate mutase
LEAAFMGRARSDGETAWSLSRQFTGRADIPLTSRGEQAARDLGTHLYGRRFSRMLVSPLLRARQTADLIGFGAGAVPEPDLVEWDFGQYEGCYDPRHEDHWALRPEREVSA